MSFSRGIFYETAEIVSINPLYPPILRRLFEAGGHPQTPGAEVLFLLDRRWRLSFLAYLHQSRYFSFFAINCSLADINTLFVENKKGSLYFAP